MKKNSPLLVEKLNMWKDNVRYSYKLDSEKECIEELFERNPGIKKMRTLFQSVVEDGYFMETLIVYNDRRNGFIVLDGNRRLSLMKIIAYPELVEKFKLDQSQLKEIENINEIMCDIYENLEDAYNHVERRHQGEQNGAGIVLWDSSGKERMKEIRGEEASIGYAVVQFFKKTKSSQFKYVKEHINNISTINRILKSKYVFNSIFNLNSAYEYDLSNEKHIIKLNEILIKLYQFDPKGRVKHVYYKDDIETLFFDVLPINGVQQLSIENVTDIKSRSEKKTSFSNSSTNSVFSQNSYNDYSEIGEILFAWRNMGLIIDDDIFKYYINKLISLNINSTSSDDNIRFIFKLAPIFYRILLEIAINRYISFFNNMSNRNKFNSILQTEIDAFNTTSNNVSVVNFNKLQNLLFTAKKIKDKNKKEKIKQLIKVLNRISLGNENGIKRYVDDLNEVVHGVVINIDVGKIRNYDISTRIYLQIISEIIN